MYLRSRRFIASVELCKHIISVKGAEFYLPSFVPEDLKLLVE